MGPPNKKMLRSTVLNYNAFEKRYLWICDWRQSFVFEFFDGLFVLSKIELCSHQNDRHVWAVMTDLGIPLSTDVLERGRIHQRKTNQENILAKKTELILLIMTITMISFCNVFVNWDTILMKQKGITLQLIFFPYASVKYLLRVEKTSQK